MSEDARENRLTELNKSVTLFTATVEELMQRVGDPEMMANGHGWLPAERRELALQMFAARRESEILELRERVATQEADLKAVEDRAERTRIPELATGVALAVVAASVSSVWELAALAWLVLLAVPLAFIDMAVRRLPDPLTATAFAGTLTLLAVAALADHQLGHLGRAATGVVALACIYLILSVISPGGLGLGDAKLAASAGAVLGWIGWRALLSGTFAAFALAGVYGGALLALHRATRSSQLPLGPFILLGTLAAIAL